MADSHHTLLTFGIAVMAGILCQVTARHVKFPAIVLLLAAGAVLGPEVLGWVQPRSLGAGLFGLVELGVAIILFEGGLNLQSSRLRRQEKPIRFLITIGAAVTLAGGFLAAYTILRWPWQLCLLFGSLIIVTGPTVVAPLIRDMRLHPRLKTILEAEGVLIDPIGAIAAFLCLQVVLAPSVKESITPLLWNIVSHVGFGIVGGIVGGILLGLALRFRKLIPHGLQNVFVLGFVLLLFTVCEEFFATAGIMAVTVAGIVVGYMTDNSERELQEFKDQLTALLIGLLFILLAADVSIRDVTSLGWPGVLTVTALIVIVRPLSAFLSTSSSNLSTRERFFIGSVAPRGIVAAAIASLTADQLALNGIEGGDALRGLIFLTIASTVVLAGITARPLASLLQLRLPSRNRVAVLRADGLGLMLGDELKEAGVPVVFLDSDPKSCDAAQRRGHSVVYGDALHERTLSRAQFELVGTVVGLSSNEHLNSLFCYYAREFFKVPRLLAGVIALPQSGLPNHFTKVGADVAFDGPHDMSRWRVRLRHNHVKVERFQFEPPEPPTAEEEQGDKQAKADQNGERGATPTATGEGEGREKGKGNGESGQSRSHASKESNPAPQSDKPAKGESGGKNDERSAQKKQLPYSINDRWVVLAITRGESIHVMSLGFKLKTGDIASIAIYAEEYDLAVKELAERGWNPPPPPEPGEAEAPDDETSETST